MECAHQLQDDALIPNLGTCTELANFIIKETCHSSKQSVFNRLKADTNSNNDIVSRFKSCEVKPLLRENDADELTSKPGAQICWK